MASGEFTYWRLVWSNLRVRPVRTVLSVVAVAMQVVLLLLIVGMINGVVTEWGQRVEGVGADILVRPPNSSIFFAFSSASMAQSLGDKLVKVPGVEAISPVLVMVQTRQLNIVYGIDYRSFNDLSQGFKYLAGGPFGGPNDVIVDNIKAQTQHLSVGEHISLLGHGFTVCGVVESGKGARLFIPLATAQAITGASGHVSMFYVRSSKTAPALARLRKLLPGYQILSMQEYLTLMNSSNLPQLNPFIHSILALGVLISFLVVFLATYTIVLERTHEIGILKALGASRGQLMALVLEETLVMAAFGVVLGLGVTALTRVVLHHDLPSLTILIPGYWIANAIVVALAAAAAGALYPAYRASRFDPIDALGYE